MAEGILRKLIGERTPDSPRPAAVGAGLPLEIASAGTAAIDGLPATEEAIAVCRGAGIQIEDHRSRRLTAGLLAECELVLTMEQWHRFIAMRLLPERAERVHHLALFAGDGRGGDVEDPIGGGPEEYRRAFARIRDLLQRALPQILEQSQRKG
jgi:protein-tyrosine-phosphatase